MNEMIFCNYHIEFRFEILLSLYFISKIMDQLQQLIQQIIQDPLSAIFLILVVIILEVILSFDNAAVLATMVKELPKDQQPKALKYGIIGAYVFRGLALIAVESILEFWWLKPIGGAYLLYMAIKHFSNKSVQQEIEEEVQETKRSLIYRSTVGVFGVFWSTVLAVEFMDIVFSIDNIFAVVAFSENIVLIIIGVFVGILAMRFVAKYFVVLMERYPSLEKAAFVVIGLLGIKLCLSMVVHYFPQMKWLESEQFDMFVSALTLVIFAVPLVLAKKKGK